MASVFRLDILIFVVGVLHVQQATSQTQACKDLDTHACELLQKSSPNLCSTPALADVACKRFCGHCPLTCYHCPQPTNDTHGCTATMACPTNQTCMMKTLSSKNGFHQYIATCEDKQICEGVGFGFGLVGRRHVEPRNVAIKCCHTDLCNTPLYSSTTPSNTPVPTTALHVSGCTSDIIIAVDESRSIGKTEYGHLITFIKQVVTALDIGPHADQVGLLLYDYSPHLQWNLNEYPTKAELLNALTYVPYHDGGTRTDLALKYIRENMFKYAVGDRINARNVVVVISDGNSNQHPATVSEAQKIHQLSSDVIAIGVGAHVGLTELTQIATDRNHAFKAIDFQSLLSLVPNIVREIC